MLYITKMDNYSNDQDMASRISNLNENDNIEVNQTDPNYISPAQVQQLKLLQQQLYQQQIQQQQQQQQPLQQQPPIQQEQPFNYKQKFMENLPELIKEPSIVAILFIIFSFPSIREQFSKYIPQMKSNPDGSISITGLTIMGIIVGIIYIFIKKAFVKE
jgi:hypothetical protein